MHYVYICSLMLLMIWSILISAGLWLGSVLMTANLLEWKNPHFQFTASYFILSVGTLASWILSYHEYFKINVHDKSCWQNFFLKTKNAFFWSLTFIFFLIFRCRERLRLAKQTPDHEGPIHPIYSRFHLRRSLRRICHYYHHPSQPHRRFEEVSKY